MDSRVTLCLLVLAGSAPLAGCGTYASFTEINSPPHEMSSRPPSRIQVFSSGPPSRPYVDVAVIRVEQTHSLNEQSAELMIRRIREQAGAIGCDAVVLGGITDHNGAQPGLDETDGDLHRLQRQRRCSIVSAGEGTLAS
jgi:hypothetical protein